jgi:hypothetical protein
VNGRPLELVEPRALQFKLQEPILLLGKDRFADIDIRIRVKGGGHTSQIYAIRQALSKVRRVFFHHLLTIVLQDNFGVGKCVTDLHAVLRIRDPVLFVLFGHRDLNPGKKKIRIWDENPDSHFRELINSFFG